MPRPKATTPRSEPAPFSRQEAVDLAVALAQLRAEVTRDDSRFQRYTSPLGQTHGVTTILTAMAKEALVYWSSKVQSEACEAEALDWLQSPEDQRGDLLRRLVQVRQAQNRIKRAAADAGVEGHRLAEAVFRKRLGLDVPPRPPLEHPREASLMCAAILEWADGAKIEPVAVEQPTWSRYGYAGTLDLLAIEDGNVLSVIDWKSNPKAAIYPESYLQNMALRGALKEHGIYAPRGTVVIVPRDGQGEIRPVRMGWREDDLSAFYALVVLHGWMKAIDRELRGADG